MYFMSFLGGAELSQQALGKNEPLVRLGTFALVDTEHADYWRHNKVGPLFLFLTGLFVTTFSGLISSGGFILLLQEVRR